MSSWSNQTDRQCNVYFCPRVYTQLVFFATHESQTSARTFSCVSGTDYACICDQLISSTVMDFTWSLTNIILSVDLMRQRTRRLAERREIVKLTEN